MLGFVLLNNDSPDINSVYVSIFENVIRYNRKNNPNGDFVWDYWERGGQYAGFFSKNLGIDKTFFDGDIAAIPDVVRAYQNNPHTPYYPEIIVGGGVDQVAASGKITHFLNNAKASRVAAVEFVNVPPSPLCAA